MPDTTSVNSIRFRELARILEAEKKITDGLTPAGALTTIAGALRGSLVEECHGAVALGVLEAQEEVGRMCGDEIGALRSAADVFDEQERANAEAIGRSGARVGGPR